MSKVESAYKNYLVKPRLLYIDSKGGEVIYIPFKTDLPTLGSVIDKVLNDVEFNEKWSNNCTRELNSEEKNRISYNHKMPKRVIVN